ncbi:hypothetical protein MMC14_007775 [Varicellaria rhodocarpa]|nr:hypothetical protein [Varicellaria rhodocarpa]
MAEARHSIDSHFRIDEQGDIANHSIASEGDEDDEDDERKDALGVDGKEVKEETIEPKLAKSILKDYGNYLHLIEDRVSTVEKKAQRIEGQDTETKDAETKSPTKRVPAIPELRRVEWHEFKNKYVGDKSVCAIEVLVGNAKFYYQRREEETQRRKRKSRRSDEATTSAEAHSYEHGKEMPERIRINSLPVLSILAEVSSRDPWKEPVVMLRPYKPLVYYKSKLRSCLYDLETRWASAEAEKARDSVEGSQPTIETPREPNISEEIDVDKTTSRDAQALHQPEQSIAPDEAILGCVKINTAEQQNLSDDKASDQDPLQMTEELKQLLAGQAIEDLTDSVEALRDLRCLIQFIDQEIRPLLNQIEDGSISKVHFRDL